MRKAFVRWAGAAAVVAVAVLLLTTDGGLPLLPGKSPTASDSGPGKGPMADIPALHARLIIANLETYDLSSQAVPATDELAVPSGRELFDADVDGLESFADLDGDGSQLRSELDRLPDVSPGTLASVLLALMVLRASLGRNREQRPTAAIAA